jgi:hypothetical protein
LFALKKTSIFFQKSACGTKKEIYLCAPQTSVVKKSKEKDGKKKVKKKFTKDC